ncbi:MAG: peptidoglycan DD-metalloendopeptidase family protein [Balneolia bacterium]|nr:peptidoglycan DD-metalloendopeptidase family protein [Balneolia bacterium]
MLPFSLPSPLLFLVISVSSLLLISCNFGDAKKTDVQNINVITVAEEPEPVPTDMFGLPAAEYSVVERRVRNGETLSAMLSPYGIGHQQVHAISQASQDVFNLRRINSGRDVRFYINEDDGLDFFVYQPSRRDYVVFDLRDQIDIYTGEREESRVMRHIEGRIDGSLYVSLLEQGGSPALVSRLAQVFAWQVDFYRIQRGDRYAVVYEELLIDDEVVGVGRIHAAWLSHRGREYHGIYFAQGENAGTYFDLEGNSLQKAFLRAPLDYTRISSRFTNRRYHPVLQRNMPHHGTDYAAPTGTPIRAVGDGVITHSAYDRNNGNFIRIRHNSVYETGYLHMSRIASGMRKGASVRQGDIIGYVGATGLATGPHLCFRFWQNGQPVDPYRVEMPPSEPVEPAYVNQFNEVKIAMVGKLFPDEKETDKPLLLAGDGTLQHSSYTMPMVLIQ